MMVVAVIQSNAAPTRAEFHAAIARRSGHWYGACLKITRDADMAADAVQDALLLAAIHSESTAAPNFDADGWHTWRVQSVDNSVRCCGTWTSGKLTSSGCNLDTGRSTRICDDLATSDEVQIYVKSEAGKVVEIRAFSPQCPVESEHKIHDLGMVDNAESVAWLTP